MDRASCAHERQRCSAYRLAAKEVTVNQPTVDVQKRSARVRQASWRRIACWAVVITLACRGAEDYALYERMTDRRAPETDGVSIGFGSADARFVNTVIGLRNPESVRYDPAQDVYFISNMFGYGSVKDGNGYIVRVNAADLNRSTVFIKSGSAGVTLDAPKGMAISGDTLWVTDIDKLRGFHRVTGAPLATIDFAPAGAVLLNDVAVGANGEIRVTDTGIRMTEVGNYFVGPAHIYAVGPNAAVRTVVSGAPAGQPNGIAWDGAQRRWIVVSFDQFRWNVSAIQGDSIRPLLAREKQGKLDGVEVLPSGGILYSSWADSSLHLLEGGRDRQVIREVVAPADIGYDPRRQRVMIPLPTLGWVQLWALADSVPPKE
jgi:sugar lactone lactonase YvrE